MKLIEIFIAIVLEGIYFNLNSSNLSSFNNKKKLNSKAAIICHGQSTNSNSSEIEKPEGLEAFGYMTMFVIGFSILSLILCQKDNQ